jgi:hypothetical protein
VEFVKIGLQTCDLIFLPFYLFSLFSSIIPCIWHLKRMVLPFCESPRYVRTALAHWKTDAWAACVLVAAWAGKQAGWPPPPGLASQLPAAPGFAKKFWTSSTEQHNKKSMH